MSQERPQTTHMGVPIGTGIGLGRAYVLYSDQATVVRYRLQDPGEVPAEQQRFRDALEAVRVAFEGLKETLREVPSQDPLLILQTHLDLLTDPQIHNKPLEIIASEQVNAEWALWSVWREIREVFEAIEDEYIKTRAEDIRHLVTRILAELGGGQVGQPAGPTEESVVVVKTLAPDDAIQLAQIPVAGFVAEDGSVISHAAIIARTFGIPTVMGVEGITREVNGGESMIVDGNNGVVSVDPPEKVLAQARRKRQAQIRRRAKVLAETNLPAVTPDGFVLRFHANIELPEEIPLALERGAEGIGLYRTEYLFLSRDEPPDLDEMTDHYADVVHRLKGRPVTFRTMDIGGDKLPRSISLDPGNNPAMGLRGIRYSLSRPDFFEAQVRAILRASRHGPVKLLLPLITGYEELVTARRHIEQVAADEGIDPIPVGVMIETPISVMTADVLARDADFFSIGTNDLIQYALAVDRSDEMVAYLYAPLHLGILRMLQRVVEVGHEAGLPVGVCGEMAGDPMFSLVLLGLGVDSLSMTPAAIPTIRAIVRRTPIKEAQELMQGIFALKDPDEIERILERELHRRFEDLLED